MANSVDAIALLTADHDEVRGIFREFDGNGAQAEQMLHRIRDMLKTHTAIEQEIFYPALQSGMPDEVKAARQEHKEVDELLNGLGRLQSQDVRFAEQMRELIESVEHHAGEEEREMFPQAKEMLGVDELRRLGEQMRQRKNMLTGQLDLSAA